jgi:hypothetical protein
MSAPKQLARIFMPPRSAMQSGAANTHRWVLEFAPAEPQLPDPLMGWAGSGDTERQVRLRFETEAEAVAYAEAHGIAHEVEQPKPHRIKPKSYAENFRFGRAENWTH